MKKILTLIIVFVGFAANSQVTVDPTFNSMDWGFGDYLGARGTVNDQVIQSDGKILIGGDMTGYNGFQSTTAGNLIRLNADGSRDASFGVANGANGIIWAIALQTDGKIVIAGNFTTYSGVTVNRICRLNSNGSFDPTFNPGIGFSGTPLGTSVYDIKIQTDGKVLAVGTFTSYNGNASGGICRINSDGSFDNTFNNGSAGFNNSAAVVKVIELQTDGKILVGGKVINNYNGTAWKGLIRLNADGSKDNSFTLSNVNFDFVASIKVRPDNKIWVGGTDLYAGNTLNYVGILLLNADGTNDYSFSPATGVGFNSSVSTITPIGSTKLFIGGRFTSFNGTSRSAMAIINIDGSLDVSVFSTNSYTNSSAITSSNIDASNNIIYSGGFDNNINGRNNNIERINSSYAYDLSFNAVFGSNTTVKTFATQPDGKIIIGGAFTRFNNVERNRIARLTVNGELDNTFTVGAGLNNDINDIAIQPNGSIIAVGSFTNYNSTNVNRIVRTDASGAIDASFATNIGTGANGEINTVALQADGKIIIGGNFTSFNGNSSNYIARLNSNGTFDNTFNIGTGAFGLIRVIRIQPDGKVLVGGDFQFFNGVAAGRIIRLNVDGTSDNTFNPSGTGASGNINDIQIASDGKIIIGGSFNNFNGTGAQNIVRLLSSGSIDNSFSLFSFIINRVRSISLYNNGKILLVYNGEISDSTRCYFKRLNNNGTDDNTFAPGSTTHASILKAQIIGNGNKVLIAGSFTSSFNNVGRNRIARLIDASITAVPLTLQSFTGNLQNGNTQLNWHTSNEINTDQFIIERSFNNTSFNAVGTIVAKGNNTNAYQFTDFNTSNLGATTLYYRLKMQDKNGGFTYSATVPIKLSLKTNITLLPNPVKNTAWLQIQQTSTEKINISVSDISGKIIMQQNPTITSGTTVIPLQVSQLAAGVYFVTIKGSNKNETLKLIKE